MATGAGGAGSPAVPDPGAGAPFELAPDGAHGLAAAAPEDDELDDDELDDVVSPSSQVQPSCPLQYVSLSPEHAVAVPLHVIVSKSGVQPSWYAHAFRASYEETP